VILTRERPGIRPTWLSRALWAAALGLAGLAFVWLISYVALVQLAGLTRPPREIHLVIPPGTASQVAAGQSLSAIPTSIRYVVGDVLVVFNDDEVSHRVGPFDIPPGRSAYLSLGEPNAPAYACSIHPGGSLGLEVQPRADLRLTVLPTLALGVPLALTLGLVFLVVSRIDTN
jgi:hypothetical protein